jgi:hypothetical protein
MPVQQHRAGHPCIEQNAIRVTASGDLDVKRDPVLADRRHLNCTGSRVDFDETTASNGAVRLTRRPPP